MLKFDEQKVREILIKELKKYPQIADQTIKVLKGLQSDLQEPLDQWLQDRSFSDQPSVEGVTLQLIQKKLRCDFLQCLILMDDFLENPENAIGFNDLLERRPR